MTKHIDTGEYIQAQQERIDRLQAELQWHRTNRHIRPQAPTPGGGQGVASNHERKSSCTKF